RLGWALRLATRARADCAAAVRIRARPQEELMTTFSPSSAPRRSAVVAFAAAAVSFVVGSATFAREPRETLGATHVNGTYSLTDEPYLIEGARRIQELGFQTIKLYLYPPPANNSSDRAYAFHSPDWPEMRTPTDVAKS